MAHKPYPAIPETPLFDHTLNLGRPIHAIQQEKGSELGLDQLPETASVLPGTPLLQTYSAIEVGHQAAQNPEQLVAKALAHYTALQKFGMCLVSHTIEARPGLAPVKHRRRPETIVAYAATNFVDHTVTLQHTTTQEVPRQKIEEFVVQPLLNYLQWGGESGQQEMLSDIYHPQQYSWQSTSGVLFLHDIAPLFTQVNFSDDTLFGTNASDLRRQITSILRP